MFRGIALPLRREIKNKGIMDKKIILVTGASSGIGRATALELAPQGHTLIIHGRDAKKTKEVCDEIIATTGNNSVEMLTADLSLMTEVKAFADKVAQKYDHLDVLINNAGGQFGETREMTKEGHEKTFAINTLLADETAVAAAGEEPVSKGRHGIVGILPAGRRGRLGRRRV